MIKAILKEIVPDSMHSEIRNSVDRIKYFGFSKYCPVCDSHTRKFLPFGVVTRSDALCPFCGSLERHRLLWEFFHHHTDLFDPNTKRMLHIAPEAQFSRVFRYSKSIDYVSGDIDEKKAMEKVDVTDIKYEDGTFDVIYCSHVLEHVPKDKVAMHELHRVLAPGGWAVLQVPITAEETFGDPSITDPKERERLFGQHNHVRRYGPDYKDRLEQSGFNVQTFSAVEVVGEKDIEKMGIMKDEDIFFCTK